MATITIRLITIFIVFLSASGWAATSARLDSTRVSVFGKLNIPIAGNSVVTTAIANTAINESIQRVCRDFPAVEKLDTIVLSKTAHDYALNSDFDRLNWAIRFDGQKIITMEYAPVTQLFDAEGGFAGADPKFNDVSAPRYTFAFNKRVWVYSQVNPAVDLDTMIVAYYAIDSLLQAAGSQMQVLPGFRQAVITYACYLLSLVQEKADMASVYLTEYNRLLNVESGKVDKKEE